MKENRELQKKLGYKYSCFVCTPNFHTNDLREWLDHNKIHHICPFCGETLFHKPITWHGDEAIWRPYCQKCKIFPFEEKQEEEP